MNATQIIERIPPTCEECRSLLLTDADGDETPTRVSALFTPEEVFAATHGRQRETTTHAVKKTSVLHRYVLTTDIECALPDKTRHRRGYVVRTLCGRVINIGHRCGVSRIVGLDESIKHYAKAELHAEHLSKLALVPSMAVDMLAVRSRLDRIHDFRERLAAHLPRLQDVIDDERRRGTAKRGEIEIRGTRLQLLGLAMWDRNAKAFDVSVRYRTLCGNIERARAADPNLEAAAARLVRETDDLRAFMQEADHWADACERFFGDQNLAAIVALSRTQNVFVEANELVFDEGSERVRLGLRGMRREPRKPVGST
jgi:hypothetical protein